MNWSDRRRLIIIGSVVALFILLISATLFAFIYKAPSCTDGKKNQSETGIDCGGICSRICTVEVTAPFIDFTRAVQSARERTDIIAYVENKNTAAESHSAPYRVDVYSANNSLIATREGTVDLPAASLVPIFIPGVISGYQQAQTAYLTFDQDAIVWTHAKKAERILPAITNIVADFTTTPKISATIVNESPEALYNVLVVVTVKASTPNDPEGTVIGATQTIVPSIPAQGSAPIIVTWNQSFVSTPTEVQMIPVIPLVPGL